MTYCWGQLPASAADRRSSAAVGRRLHPGRDCPVPAQVWGAIRRAGL